MHYDKGLIVLVTLNCMESALKSSIILISSSVYSSIELRAAKTYYIPYFLSVLVYLYLFLHRFAISFASFCFTRQFHRIDRRLFFKLWFRRDLYSTAEKSLACYFKSIFQMIIHLGYRPFLALACFQHMLWRLQHGIMVLVNKASIWAVR